MKPTDKPVNLGRHQLNCKICAHTQRDEIEADFVGWRSPSVITEMYGLADRTSVYRHAHALGLMQRRRKNVRAALERMIERAEGVELTASAVVAAIQAYSKINAAGQWVERTEQVSLNELFDRMSADELEEYAQSGILPKWFEVMTRGATGGDSRDE